MEEVVHHTGQNTIYLYCISQCLFTMLYVLARYQLMRKICTDINAYSRYQLMHNISKEKQCTFALEISVKCRRLDW